MCSKTPGAATPVRADSSVHRRSPHVILLPLICIFAFILPRHAPCGASNSSFSRYDIAAYIADIASNISSFSRHDIAAYIAEANVPAIRGTDDSIVNSLYPWKGVKLEQQDSSTKMLDNDGRCRLYFARSSIPNAGFGVYSGVDVVSAEPIANPAIGLILADMNFHVGNRYVRSILNDYHWHSWTIENGQFLANMSSTMIPGIGMTANAHLGLNNARILENARHKLGSMDRTTDCGAGSVSDFLGVDVTAKVDIVAGSEIFLSYGEAWFVKRGYLIPFEQNYLEADHIIHKFLLSLEAVGKEWSAKERVERWQRVLGETGAATRMALPESVHDLEHASEVGSARHSVPDSQRSIEWLDEHGLCMDNIRAGPSTIPQAGRGAFASRIIPKGTLISPAPVVPVKRDLLFMYRQNDDGDEVDGQHQLALNYCFGHKNSSVFLFPYSSSVQFINHSGKDVNAAIQWSISDFNHVDLLGKPLDDIKSSGLVLEIVASRDIMLGEEVLIDYGDEWQLAWQRHVREWKPEDPKVSEVELNNDMVSVVRTVDEPAYPGIQTTCYYSPSTSGGYNLVQRGTAIRWETAEDGNQPKYLRPCDILSRRRIRGHIFYTARINNFDDLAAEDRVKKSVDDVISQIPRWAIKFVEAPYANDQFSEQAFRHEIGLPSGLMPPHWFDRSD